MKRVIITNKQLNEIIKEENTTTVQLNTTGNTIPAVTNTVISNTPEINNASKYGDVNLHISNQKLNGSNDSVPTQHVEVERGQNINQAIQQQVNPTVLSDGGDIEVSGDGISEGKSFSKRQIEEARLEKIRKEGSVMTKKQLKEEWEEKPINKDEIDWNQRKQMRMDNFWDTLEYYIGLKDEQGGLNPEQLADAKNVCDKLSCFGADAEEFCDYAREILGLGEIQESKIEIKPENKGKFNATKKRTGKSTEELTHSKNPLTRKRAVFAQNAKRWNKK